MFEGVNIAGSGMSAAKKMMEITGNNIANINTTRAENGNPYRRQAVVLQARNDFETYLDGTGTGKGVEISAVVQDDAEKLVYEPEHVDANVEGYVRMPNIDLTAEMTNLIVAQRTYEGNASVLSSNRQMMEKELEIGKY